MTDLERARAHLRVCQESLRLWRTAGFDYDYLRASMEDNFLAALSWVWEEQQRIVDEFVFPRESDAGRWMASR